MALRLGVKGLCALYLPGPVSGSHLTPPEVPPPLPDEETEGQGSRDTSQEADGEEVVELGLEQLSGTEPCHETTSAPSKPSRQALVPQSIRPEAGVGEEVTCQGKGGMRERSPCHLVWKGGMRGSGRIPALWQDRLRASVLHRGAASGTLSFPVC